MQDTASHTVCTLYNVLPDSLNSAVAFGLLLPDWPNPSLIRLGTTVEPAGAHLVFFLFFLSFLACC